ncbi:hypothetical protein JCM33374_g886 [Metschnikowia sp. JCM 33374]|nr:hypothetical protein JCM33374_g886 [Metschnikowia sp. JCM 33374]
MEIPVPVPRVSTNRLYPDLNSFSPEENHPQNEESKLKPTPKHRTNINGLYPDLSSFDSELQGANSEAWKPTPRPREHHLNVEDSSTNDISEEVLNDPSTDWGISVKDKAQKLEAMLRSEKTNTNIEKAKKIGGVKTPLWQDGSRDEVEADVKNNLDEKVQDSFPENSQFNPKEYPEYSDAAESSDESEYSEVYEDSYDSDYSEIYEDSDSSEYSEIYADNVALVDAEDSDGGFPGKQNEVPKSESRKEEGKFKSFFNALKSIVKSGTSIFRSSSKEESEEQTNLTATPVETQRFLIGNAAWTINDNDNVSDGFDGGIDSSFIAKSEDGQMLAFGILDSRKIEGINTNSKPFAKEMCQKAQKTFEAISSSNDWSPSEVMKAAFQETILDTTVSAGSAAGLFGVIDDKNRLQLSYTGTAWASVYRHGQLVHQTRLMRDAEDEKYNLVKVPYSVKAHDHIHIDEQNDKLFSSFEKDSWALEKGDVVLVATNGLYKRLGSEDIKKSIKISLESKVGMEQAANSLVGTAIGLAQVDMDGKLFWVRSQEKTEDIVVLTIEIM